MSEVFNFPDPVLAWANGRLEAADQPVTLHSIGIDGDGVCRVTGTVKKFMISADMEVRFRIRGKEKTLLIEGIEIATTNPLGKTLIPQIKSLLIEKARGILSPLAIEVVDS